jgi:predicted O-methyltransferase YrrM
MADHSSRTGTSYATPAILRYLDELHGPHDAALDRAFDAPAQAGMPAIQVGRAEGLMLEWLTRWQRPTVAVEIGALAGYSAIRIGRGLRGPEARLYTIERDPKHAAVARANVEAAGLGDRVEVIEGDAVDVLNELGVLGPVDLVFVDADKERYDAYATWAAQAMRPGGLLIGDNVFFFGRLLEESSAAEAMRRFHAIAREHFDTTVVPTPDGMLLGRKR